MKEKRQVLEDLKTIDQVINSLYDDYEMEQEYAQKVIGAWSRIRDKLEDPYQEFEDPYQEFIPQSQE